MCWCEEGPASGWGCALARHFHARHHRHCRLTPLGQPRLHLLNLWPLRGLDLIGQIHNTAVDSLLGEDDIAHLYRLLMVRNHVLSEHDVGWVVRLRR